VGAGRRYTRGEEVRAAGLPATRGLRIGRLRASPFPLGRNGVRILKNYLETLTADCTAHLVMAVEAGVREALRELKSATSYACSDCGTDEFDDPHEQATSAIDRIRDFLRILEAVNEHQRTFRCAEVAA